MNKVIVIAGPTASGKTGLGIEVAKAVGGEIISADSMQVYKNMPIATACPTEEEKNQVPHYLVEFLDNDESFSVAKWCELAKEKIDLTDDEIRNLIGSNFKVKFPYIMFSVCVMFEIGTLLLALVSLVLSFILLPMGLIIGAISAISSAVMSLIVFACCAVSY